MFYWIMRLVESLPTWICVLLTVHGVVVGDSWSSWSEWSECSRTCDGGAAYQLRRCENEGECEGDNIRYKTCNNQNCPGGTSDFRGEQCAAYHDVPYDGILYSWEMVYDPRTPCALRCRAQDAGFTVQLAPKVLDGTRCGPNMRDMCINGQCREVGCDHVIGSQARVDVCGVCGGTGQTCAPGRRDRPTPFIWEESDFSLCSVTCGVGEQTTEVKCKDTQSGHYVSEKLCAASEKPQIRSRVCTLPACSAGWIKGEWQSCSKSCGEGISRRHLYCVTRLGDGSFRKTDEAHCSALPRPEVEKRCNKHRCPRWYAGEWSPCSVTCGEGQQFREVICRKTGRHACNLRNRPTTSKKCSTSASCMGEKAETQDRVPFSMSLMTDEEAHKMLERLAESQGGHDYDSLPDFGTMENTGFSKVLVRDHEPSMPDSHFNVDDLPTEFETLDSDDHFNHEEEEDEEEEEEEEAEEEEEEDTDDHFNAEEHDRYPTFVIDSHFNTDQPRDSEASETDTIHFNMENDPKSSDLDSDFNIEDEVMDHESQYTDDHFNTEGLDRNPTTPDTDINFNPEDLGTSDSDDHEFSFDSEPQEVHNPFTLEFGAGGEDKVQYKYPYEGLGLWENVDEVSDSDLERDLHKITFIDKPEDLMSSKHHGDNDAEEKSFEVTWDEEESPDTFTEGADGREVSVLDPPPPAVSDVEEEDNLPEDDEDGPRVFGPEVFDLLNSLSDTQAGRTRRFQLDFAIRDWDADTWRKNIQGAAGSGEVIDLFGPDDASIDREPIIWKHDTLNGLEVPTRPSFVVSRWGPCSGSCGYGVKSRIVQCKVYLSFSNSVQDLPDSACQGDKPKMVMPCSDQEGCQAASEYDERPVDGVSSVFSPNTSYAWGFAGFGTCSASCLGGLKEPIFTCMYIQNRQRVEDHYCSAWTRPNIKPKQCNIFPCPFRWEIGQFGPCSAICGGGFQRRQVECVRELARGEENLARFPDSYCPSPVPLRTMQCNIIDCPPGWITQPWSQCSATCGQGEETRYVFCQQVVSPGRIVNVTDESICPADKPPSVRECSRDPCPTITLPDAPLIRVDVSKYVQMRKKRRVNLDIGGSAVLIPGTTVIVKCPVERFDTKAIVWKRGTEVVHRKGHVRVNKRNALMIRKSKPSDSDVYTCLAELSSANITIKFHSAEVGKNMIQKRKQFLIEHQDKLYQLTETPQFQLSKYNVELPRDRLLIAEVVGKDSDLSIIPYVFVTLDWTPCSETCGGMGRQFRTASCEFITVDYFRVVEDGMCHEFGWETPPTSRLCGDPICPRWRVGNWEECSDMECSRNGVGTVRRPVACVTYDGTHTGHEHCENSTKPEIARECVNRGCRATWKTSHWTRCSKSCGGAGVRSRLLQCVWWNSKSPAGINCKGQPRPVVVKPCKAPPCTGLHVCQDESKYCSIASRTRLCRFKTYRKRCCRSCSIRRQYLRQAGYH